MSDISLLALFRKICCSKRHNKIAPEGFDALYINGNLLYIKFINILIFPELPSLAHQGLASYDIKLNDKYTNIIRAINGLGKDETRIKSLNGSDEEKKNLMSVARPSLFKKNAGL